MSQPKHQQIALTDLKEWLRREVSTTLEPVQSKATSLLKDVQQRLDDALESMEKMLQNSEKEMEKSNPKTYRYSRNANKLARTCSETMKSIVVPEQISYLNLQAFTSELEKALALIEQQRREGYPYITPYFIFDRRRLDVVLKRVADGLQETRSFLATKYARVKTIEDTNALIDKLSETMKRTEEIEKETNTAGDNEGILEQQLDEIHQKITVVQGKPEPTELVRTNEKIEELRENVKHSLRYLQKPFYKLQSLTKSSDIAIPIDEAKKLEEYLEDPFEAFATEEAEYPTLKGILQKLDVAITKGKLKLKSSRLRKAQEQTESILNKGSLDALQKSCAELLARKNQLLTSTTIVAVQSELEQLRGHLEELQKQKDLATSRKHALKNEHTKLLERTQNLKGELEKTIFQLTNKNVQVVFT
jgi:hypothetical protein